MKKEKQDKEIKRIFSEYKISLQMGGEIDFKKVIFDILNYLKNNNQ